MEANRKRSRWTYAEYARLPSEGSTRYEVIDGEVAVTPSPTSTHQRLVMRLAARLHAFAEEHGLGEVFPAPLDVLLGDGDYYQPDVLLVRRDRLDLITDRGVEAPPDLVIEITSPSTADRDRGIKRDRYRFFGVPEYWIVDPEDRSVEVWDLAAGVNEPARLDRSDTLRWTPMEDGPTLEFSLPGLFDGV